MKPIASLSSQQAPTKSAVCAQLLALEPALRARQVKALLLFGSVARNEAHTDSDIDIAIRTEESFSLIDLSALTLFLKEQLGRPVDVLVDGEETHKNPLDHLRPSIRESLRLDGVDVF